MLNRKKNYSWVYILAGIAVAGLFWLVSQEMPFSEETVEQPLDNTFAK